MSDLDLRRLLCLLLVPAARPARARPRLQRRSGSGAPAARGAPPCARYSMYAIDTYIGVAVVQPML